MRYHFGSSFRGRGDVCHLFVSFSLCLSECYLEVTFDTVVAVERSAFKSYQESVYDSTDLETMYERMVAKMLESFSAFLKNGSGWTLKRIIKLDITPARNEPVKGSSYIPLPKVLKDKKSLINIENKKDHHCFKWSILRYLNPTKDHPERISDLKEHVNEFNWGSIEFPTSCSERMYKKFEKNNDISLLVFGHKTVEEETHIIPLYVPTPTERREKTVRLFFYKNENGESHCCVVTNMCGLMSK